MYLANEHDVVISMSQFDTPHRPFFLSHRRRPRRHHMHETHDNHIYSPHEQRRQPKTRHRNVNALCDRESIANTHYGTDFVFPCISLFFSGFAKEDARACECAHAHLLCSVCKFDVIIYLFRRCRKSTNINNYLLISASLLAVAVAMLLKCAQRKINANNNFSILKNGMAANTVDSVRAHAKA